MQLTGSTKDTAKYTCRKKKFQSNLAIMWLFFSVAVFLCGLIRRIEASIYVFKLLGSSSTFQLPLGKRQTTPWIGHPSMTGEKKHITLRYTISSRWDIDIVGRKQQHEIESDAGIRPKGAIRGESQWCAVMANMGRAYTSDNKNEWQQEGSLLVVCGEKLKNRWECKEHEGQNRSTEDRLSSRFEFRK